MRIVQFDNTPNWPDVVYPEEGASAFGKTVRIGDDVVGEYNGAATDPTLPDYVGTWPIPTAPVYRTMLSNVEMFVAPPGFSGAEQRDIETYKNNGANPQADDVYEFWSALLAATQVNLEHQYVIDEITRLETLGLITELRRDEILQGVEEPNGSKASQTGEL